MTAQPNPLDKSLELTRIYDAANAIDGVARAMAQTARLAGTSALSAINRGVPGDRNRMNRHVSELQNQAASVERLLEAMTENLRGLG